MGDSYKCFLENLERETRDLMKNPCAMQGGANLFSTFLKNLKLCRPSKSKVAPLQTRAAAAQQPAAQTTPVQTILAEDHVTCEVLQKSIADKALEENKQTPLFKMPDDILELIAQKVTDVDQDILECTSLLFRQMVSKCPKKTEDNTDYFDYFSTIVKKLDETSKIRMTCKLPQPELGNEPEDQWYMKLTFTKINNNICVLMGLKCYTDNEKKKSKQYGFGPSEKLKVYYNILHRSGFSYFNADSLCRADWYNINLMNPRIRVTLPLREVLIGLGKFFKMINKRPSAIVTPVIQQQQPQPQRQVQLPPPFFSPSNQFLDQLDIHLHSRLLQLIYGNVTPNDRIYMINAIAKFMNSWPGWKNPVDYPTFSKIIILFQDHPELLEEINKAKSELPKQNAGRHRAATKTKKKLITSRRKKQNP